MLSGRGEGLQVKREEYSQDQRCRLAHPVDELARKHELARGGVRLGCGNMVVSHLDVKFRAEEDCGEQEFGVPMEEEDVSNNDTSDLPWLETIGGCQTKPAEHGVESGSGDLDQSIARAPIQPPKKKETN